MAGDEAGPMRYYCNDCGQDVPSNDLAHPECPACDSTARVIATSGTVAMKPPLLSYKAALTGPKRHSRRHRDHVSMQGGHVLRRDRKGYVHEAMVIDRQHDPPFKWHRVIDGRTDNVDEHYLLRFDTGERWDFRDPAVEPPDWLAFDPYTSGYEPLRGG